MPNIGAEDLTAFAAAAYEAAGTPPEQLKTSATVTFVPCKDKFRTVWPGGLVLAVIAGMQAPIIMMSQNRAAEKDRLAAEQDFKVNLKSELMLEELMRKQKMRDSQMDQLNQTLAGLKQDGPRQ